MNNKRVFVVIPARSGSKGLKNKNLKYLDQFPLINYTVAAAKCLPFVERVICTTDDEKVADLAKRLGCEVPFIRPKKYSGTFSRDFSFLRHLTLHLKKSSYLPEIFLLLRIVTPLRYKKDLIKAYNIISSEKYADSLRSVCLTKSTPYKSFKLDKKTKYIKPFINLNNLYEPYNAPRQILPKVYASTGSFEFIKTECLLNKKSASGDNIIGYEVPKETFIDIDEDIDLKFAKILMKEFNFIKP